MPRRTSLVLDTNLFVLIAIGAVEGGRHIRNSDRLGKYSIQDYEKAVSVLGTFDEAYITPYIAAELSNLIDLTGYARTLAFSIIAELTATQFKCISVDVSRDFQSPLIDIFGLADCSLISLAREHVIFTNDHRLAAALYKYAPQHTLAFHCESWK
ncbi:hypothetical protein [Pseudomonas sp. KNUC1026]|uniref:hypothetical protein n=1 Tax=Pseudomonas sp. KNUC1026 TaxID=2893890 RepID=UPI001F1F568F|nr:hypothetical protein [Pseudomonas sp. KNUC1026]UFH48404.1 hypothetical protein LN139_14810 [Pseudomonas sp. KNUC1026]